MSPTALALVLTAAVFHALWNRALHVAGDRAPLMAAGLMIGGLLLAPAAIVAPPPSAVLPLVLLSAAAEAAYALLLAAAYQRGALSLVYPLARGVSPLLVTVAGMAVLGQQPGVAGVLAAAALLAGMALLATAGRRHGQGTAMLFALGTGIAIASYSVIDARAVRDTSPAGYLAVVQVLAGLLVAARTGFHVGRLRAVARPGLLVGIGSTAAYLLVLLAYQRAGAGSVATLRESSVLIGIVLSGERPGRRVWLGAGLIVAGALLAAAR